MPKSDFTFQQDRHLYESSLITFSNQIISKEKLVRPAVVRMNANSTDNRQPCWNYTQDHHGTMFSDENDLTPRCSNRGKPYTESSNVAFASEIEFQSHLSFAHATQDHSPNDFFVEADIASIGSTSPFGSQVEHFANSLESNESQLKNKEKQQQSEDFGSLGSEHVGFRRLEKLTVETEWEIEPIDSLSSVSEFSQCKSKLKFEESSLELELEYSLSCILQLI